MAESSIGALFVELGVNAAAFIDGFDKATYKAKQSAKEIGEAFEGLGEDVSGILSRFGELGGVLGEALSGAGETVQELSQYFGSLNGISGEVAIGLAGVAAGAVAAAGALTTMALAGQELVQRMELLSQKTGIGVEDLHVLDHAGATVGLSIDQMVQGFRRFDEALVGMGVGTREGQAILQSLGVTAINNKEALYQVADAFSVMANGAQKDADAVILFGRAGLGMIPFLNKGRDGFREMEELVDSYGPKVGQEAKAANEQFLISQQKLELAWERMTVAVESKVLPAFSHMLDMVSDLEKSIADYVGTLSNIPTDISTILHLNITKETTSKMLQDLGGVLEIPVRLAIATATLGASEYTGAYVQDRDILTAGSQAKGPSQKNLTGTATDVASSAASAAQAKDLHDAQALVDAAKAQTAAGYALFEIKAKIAALDQIANPEAKKQQAVLEAQLPFLEKKAALSKQLLDYSLDPKQAAPIKDSLAEQLATLGDQVSKQKELADAVNATAGARSVIGAGAQAQAGIDKQQLDAANELLKVNHDLAQAQAELRRFGLPTDKGPKVEPLVERRDALEKQIADRQKYASTIVEINERLKASEIETTSASRFQDQGVGLRAQLDALQQMNAALGESGDAIRAAKVAEEMKDEKKAIDEAMDALAAYIAVNGAGGPVVEVFQQRIVAMQQAFADNAAVQASIDDEKLENKIREETNALIGEAQAWKTVADAAGKGQEAKIAAEGVAAAQKSIATGGTPEEATVAQQKAVQTGQQNYATKVLERGAELDLNESVTQEITELELVKQRYTEVAQSAKDSEAEQESAANVVLLATAAQQDALARMNKQWDEAAVKYGSFQQKIAATLNDLSQEGNDFWTKFEGDGVKTVDSLEAGLSKLVFASAASGKGAFAAFQNAKQNLVNSISGLGESELTNVLKFSVSKAAGGLLKGTGLEALLPHAKADGSQANPFYVIQSNAIANAVTGNSIAGPVTDFLSKLHGTKAPGGTAGTLPGPLGIELPPGAFGTGRNGSSETAAMWVRMVGETTAPSAPAPSGSNLSLSDALALGSSNTQADNTPDFGTGFRSEIERIFAKNGAIPTNAPAAAPAPVSVPTPVATANPVPQIIQNTTVASATPVPQSVERAPVATAAPVPQAVPSAPVVATVPAAPSTPTPQAAPVTSVPQSAPTQQAAPVVSVPEIEQPAAPNVFVNNEAARPTPPVAPPPSAPANDNSLSLADLLSFGGEFGQPPAPQAAPAATQSGIQAPTLNQVLAFGGSIGSSFAGSKSPIGDVTKDVTSLVEKLFGGSKGGLQKADGSSENSAIWVRMASAHAVASANNGNPLGLSDVLGLGTAAASGKGGAAEVGKDAVSVVSKIFGGESSGIAHSDGSSETAALWVRMAGASPISNAGSGLSLGDVLGMGGNAAAGAAGGGAASSGLSTLGLLGGLFGGFLADGGDVTPGKAYVVGEEHPELFIPGAQGKIVPNLESGRSGNGSPTIINQMHIHGVTDMDSFKASSSQIMSGFHRVTQTALSRTRS